MKKLLNSSLILPVISIYFCTATVFAAPILQEEGKQLFQRAVEQSRKASYVVEIPSVNKNSPNNCYWQIVGDDGILCRRSMAYINGTEPIIVIDNGEGVYSFFRDKWTRSAWAGSLHRFDDFLRGLDESVLNSSEYDREDISIEGVPVIQLSIKNVQPKKGAQEATTFRRVYLIRGDNYVIVSRKLFCDDATMPVSKVEMLKAKFNPVVADDFFQVPEGEKPLTWNADLDFLEPLKQERQAAQQQRLEEAQERQRSAKVKSFGAHLGNFFMSSNGVILVLILSVIALGAAWLLRWRKK